MNHLPELHQSIICSLTPRLVPEVPPKVHSVAKRATKLLAKLSCINSSSSQLLTLVTDPLLKGNQSQFQCVFSPSPRSSIAECMSEGQSKVKPPSSFLVPPCFGSQTIDRTSNWTLAERQLKCYLLHHFIPFFNLQSSIWLVEFFLHMESLWTWFP